MFFNPRVAGGATILISIGTSSYLLFKKWCSLEQTNYFYKSSLNVSESVLDCKEKDRDYSVFLVFKEDSGAGTQDTLSFKVVDNNDKGKVRWGPGVEGGQKWNDWGIGIYKESGNKVAGEGFGAEIRVPRKGNVYNRRQSWTSLVVVCQKSNLKLKSDWNKECDKCGGRYLKSADMLFSIQENNVTISKVFDWKDDFQPKRIFCSS